MITDEDGGLVARFLEGDAAAFDALFRKYQDYVYNIIYGIVGSAEETRDLTQDVFLQVFRSLAKFRRGARFATWLYRIAVNRAVDAARAPQRRRFLPIFDTPGIREKPAPADSDPAACFTHGEACRNVQNVLMRCPVSHRKILVLRYYRDLSIDEIAATLVCTSAAAKVRLHRARQTFRTHYIAVYGADAPDALETGDAAQPAR